LQCGDTPSFAVARNAGAAATSAPFILFLDGDWSTDAQSLDRLVSELTTHRNTAIAVPKFIDDSGNGHAGHNIRKFPTAESFAAEFLMLHKLIGSEAVRKQRMRSEEQ